VPWLFPEFYLFGELFVNSFQIVLIIGGSITILGAILYAKNVSSSRILLIIGALLGGINIISLWGIRQILEESSQLNKFQESDKTNDILWNVEEFVYSYFKENKGKAFTSKAIHQRCIEDGQLDVSMTETEKILNDLHLLGKLHLDVKENVNYYFVS